MVWSEILKVAAFIAGACLFLFVVLPRVAPYT